MASDKIVKGENDMAELLSEPRYCLNVQMKAFGCLRGSSRLKTSLRHQSMRSEKLLVI